MTMEYKKIFQVVRVPEITSVRNSDFAYFDSETTYHKNLESVFEELSKLMGIPSKRNKHWYPEGDHIVFYAGNEVTIANPGDTILAPSGVQYQVHPIVATREQIAENYKVVGSI